MTNGFIRKIKDMNFERNSSIFVVFMFVNSSKVNFKMIESAALQNLITATTRWQYYQRMIGFQ